MARRDEGANLEFTTPLKGVAAPALAGCIAGRMQRDLRRRLPIGARFLAIVATALRLELCSRRYDSIK